MNSGFVFALLLAAIWSADPVHSSANFTVTHLGISHVNGIIPIKSSSIDVPDGSNIPTSVDAVLDPTGVDTRNDTRDSDLRSPHFFEVTTYPVISFKSTKINATDATHFTIVGDFTLHGQTHPVTLEAQYLGRATTPNGQQRIAYEAKTTIDRTLWGMTYGNPFAANSVDIELDIEAIKH